MTLLPPRDSGEADGNGIETAGQYDLTEAGATAFLNAANHLSGFDPGGGGEPADFEITSISRNAQGHVSLSFPTEADAAYTVHYGVDLQSWEEVGNVTGDGSEATFVDDDADRNAAAASYYRVAQLP